MTTQPLRPQPQPITPRSESPNAGHDLLRRVLAQRPVNDVAGLLRVLNYDFELNPISASSPATKLLLEGLGATLAAHPDAGLRPWRVTIGGETALVARRRCGWTHVDDRATYGGMDDVVVDVLAAGGRYCVQWGYHAVSDDADRVEIRLLLLPAVGDFAIWIDSAEFTDHCDGSADGLAEQLEGELLCAHGLNRTDVDTSGYASFDYVLASGGPIPADLLA